MNIHPIIVHFPVALLSLYVIFECVRFRRLMISREWFFIKATLLFAGGLGALTALVTGDFGRQLYPDARAIISAHETFAHWTVVIFGILALIYLVKVIDMLFGDRLRASKYQKIWNSIVAFDTPLHRGYVIVSLALLGFGVLLTTGALGGSIVYGASSDPFTQIVNGWFVGK